MLLKLMPILLVLICDTKRPKCADSVYIVQETVPFVLLCGTRKPFCAKSTIKTCSLHSISTHLYGGDA